MVTTIDFFWRVTPCSLVEMHRPFRAVCCLQHHWLPRISFIYICAPIFIRISASSTGLHKHKVRSFSSHSLSTEPGSRDIVSIGYGLNDPGFESLQRTRDSSHLQRVQVFWDLPSLFHGWCGLFHWEKCDGGREVNDSPPSCAELKITYRAVPLLPHMPSWRVQELYLYLLPPPPLSRDSS
jgi:hypothetical protein